MVVAGGGREKEEGECRLRRVRQVPIMEGGEIYIYIYIIYKEVDESKAN